VSWDIVLLRFRDGDAVAVDADDARRIVLAAEGVREIEPGVGEVVTDGVADIHFGGQSPEITFFVYAGSPTVTRIAHELARELQMVVFFRAQTAGVRQSSTRRRLRVCPMRHGAAGNPSTTTSVFPTWRCAVPPPTSKLSSVVHTANGKSGRTGNAGSSSGAVTA